MSSRTYIAVGIAPHGSQVVEWNWVENEDGARTRSYYTIVPREAVETVEVIDTTGDLPFAVECWVARATIEALADQYATANGMVVFQTTVSSGTSFTATCWDTLAETLAALKVGS